MTHRNCPNCGAPYEVELSRCPYCNTAYFDLTTIDIDHREPFFLKLRCNGMLITQLVVPMSAELESSAEEVVCSGHGGPLVSFIESRTLTTNLELIAQPFHTPLNGGQNVMLLAEIAESIP